MLANDDLGNLGRLGNQMFQYTSLRGLAQRHAYEYCLPPRHVVATRDPNVASSDITIFECFNLPEAPRMVSNFPKIMEKCNVELDKNLWERCPDNISLYGYFQTEKYFKHIEKQIREAFTFVDEVQKPTEEAFKDGYGNSEVLSVHIRRTDYVPIPDHPAQSISYYEKALKEFSDDIPVIIFSDDIDWCKEQDLFKGDRFTFSEGNNTGVDLCLQSLCTHHIIANSSYSWWGSWLAKSKKTVAPSHWFGGAAAQKNLSDLYLPGWIVI